MKVCGNAHAYFCAGNQATQFIHPTRRGPKYRVPRDPSISRKSIWGVDSGRSIFRNRFGEIEYEKSSTRDRFRSARIDVDIAISENRSARIAVDIARDRFQKIDVPESLSTSRFSLVISSCYFCRIWRSILVKCL